MPARASSTSSKPATEKLWLIERHKVYQVECTCEKRGYWRVVSPGMAHGLVYEEGVHLFASALVAHERARWWAHREIARQLEFIREMDTQIEALVREGTEERVREELRGSPAAARKEIRDWIEQPSPLLTPIYPEDAS